MVPTYYNILKRFSIFEKRPVQNYYNDRFKISMTTSDYILYIINFIKQFGIDNFLLEIQTKANVT